MSEPIISDKVLMVGAGICFGVSATCGIILLSQNGERIISLWQRKGEISAWFKSRVLGLEQCRICKTYDHCYQCAMDKEKYYCIPCLKDWIWMKHRHNPGTADIDSPCLDRCGATITLHRLQGVLSPTDYHAYCEAVTKNLSSKTKHVLVSVWEWILGLRLELQNFSMWRVWLVNLWWTHWMWRSC